MERNRIAFVIPAYNESSTIERVVNSVIEYGVPIVVNDSSSDETGILALEAGAEVVNHNCNRGYDGALNSGFEKAVEMAFEYIITFDADGQHDARIVGDMLDRLDEGYDVVVGIRPEKARIAESVFALLVSFRYGIKDPLCGFKAYSSEYYKRLGHFDSYGSIGTELMLFSLKQGAKIVQVEMPIHPREDAPRFGHIVSANLKILAALFKGLRYF